MYRWWKINLRWTGIDGLPTGNRLKEQSTAGWLDGNTIVAPTGGQVLYVVKSGEAHPPDASWKPSDQGLKLRTTDITQLEILSLLSAETQRVKKGPPEARCVKMPQQCLAGKTSYKRERTKLVLEEFSRTFTVDDTSNSGTTVNGRHPRTVLIMAACTQTQIEHRYHWEMSMAYDIAISNCRRKAALPLYLRRK